MGRLAELVSIVTLSQRGVKMAIRQGATHSWTKSSYSTGNGACVEVKSPVREGLAVRDSKVEAGPTLAFPAGSWNAFVTGVNRGAFGGV
jgi:hypothetical protein